jgi:glycosyltransferase involved in cell wall biosynthesis
MSNVAAVRAPHRTSATSSSSPRADADAGSADPLRGRDIVCFSNDWSGDPLSKTHLMRILARDNRILWVNSIGYRKPNASKADAARAWQKLRDALTPVHEVERNIFVLNPLAIPAYTSPTVRAINQRVLQVQVKHAMRQLNFRRALNWIFLPTAAVVAGTLGEERVIYHCVDEFSAFTGVSSDSLRRMEEQLVRRSDLVLVSSEPLLQTKAPFNPNTRLVRHGVDFEHFRKALLPETVVPPEIANLPRPVIGFWGLIADWVDVPMLRDIAAHFSKGSLVVMGKVTTDVSALAAMPNVHMLGRKSYADLPAYAKGFDVALNPFLINELTLNANPLKVREYLAAGLPVVATPIPEVEVLGQCLIGRDGPGFIAAIESALADPGPSVARSEGIRAESWQARIDEIREHLRRL